MKINFILLSCLKTECVHFTGIWRFWFECLTELPSASRMTQTAVRILPYVRSAPDCPSSLTQCWACKEPDRGKDTFIKMVLNWFLLKGSCAIAVFFIVHFPSSVDLAALICCMCNVLQNGKIKFVLSQSCSINNETRSCQNCLAPCHTCLFAQILTGNGESAMVYACMRIWGSELS